MLHEGPDRVEDHKMANVGAFISRIGFHKVVLKGCLKGSIRDAIGV